MKMEFDTTTHASTLVKKSCIEEPRAPELVSKV